MSGGPPAGVIGGGAVWPYADKRLITGSVLWMAVGIKVGVVLIPPDGPVTLKLFGGGEGTNEEFWERYVKLDVGERAEHAGHTVQLAESAPNAEPRPWIRLICT